jgi:hypothetical protein
MIPKPNMKRIAAADDKVSTAAEEMIQGPMWMIRQILLKHEQAVMEVMAEQQEQIQRLRMGLENCRLLAARKRKEDWAQHVLRYCSEAGIVGSITR